MSKIEIERKFLLKSLPNIDPVESIKIDQWYNKNSKGVWERVRKMESLSIRYIHTIKKSISKIENIEDEKEISQIEYDDFVSKCLISNDSRYIRKIRHIYPSDGLIWEVDEFCDGYRLIVAEIEIPNRNWKLKIPNFITQMRLLEVSGMKQFSNRSLSLNISENKNILQNDSVLG